MHPPRFIKESVTAELGPDGASQSDGSLWQWLVRSDGCYPRRQSPTFVSGVVGLPECLWPVAFNLRDRPPPSPRVV